MTLATLFSQGGQYSFKTFWPARNPQPLWSIASDNTPTGTWMNRDVLVWLRDQISQALAEPDEHGAHDALPTFTRVPQVGQVWTHPDIEGSWVVRDVSPRRVALSSNVPDARPLLIPYESFAESDWQRVS